MAEYWDKIKHFSPSRDNFGEPERMNEELIYKLDDLRSYINEPIHVTCGTQGAHAKSSQHYLGRAVDIVIPSYRGHVFDVLLDIERFGFTGVGYYPDWKYKGIRCGGWHLDNRELKYQHDDTLNYRQARWIGLSKAKYIDGILTRYHQYVELDFKNFKKHILQGDE